jgi:hypothetical protein
VDRLEIRWPDGAAETRCGLEVDRYLTVHQGEAAHRCR